MSSLGRSVRREHSSSVSFDFDLMMMRGVRPPHESGSSTVKMRPASRSLCSLDRKSSKGSGSRIGSRGKIKMRGSMPTIRDRHPISSKSMQNESWDTSNIAPAPLQRQRYILEDRTAVLGPTTVLPKPVSLNYSQQSTKKVRAVSFSKLQDVIVPNPRLRGVEADNDATDTWYSKSENDTFLTNAIERAERIDRIMQYAKSTGEASYNASTGLVSPQVLHEYISTPEEIIGLEYYLLPQKKARDNLKRHHVNVLLGVQAQAGGPMMVDSDLLADRLHESSTISTHMALERASYINKLT